jgi:hypothetical protein
MPAPSWEDLSAFLSLDDFATTATFTRESNGQVIPGVVGIFDERFSDAQSGGFEIAIGEPAFTCKSTDVAGLKRFDGCMIASEPGVAYQLAHDPLPDGTGMSVVSLLRV